ncbi:MAG: CsbD family protein [Rhodopirellula sp.]|nr:CsbD family protein [Rhodopirellula sp.]
MVNEQQLQGNWNEIRGNIRSRWGQISDDELTTFNGNVEELVGTIQRKTGESQEAIRNYLDEISQKAARTASRLTEQAGQYASQAAASMHDASRHLADTVAAGYSDAERLVQTRPAESLAVAFGLGLITGVVIGMLASSR